MGRSVKLASILRQRAGALFRPLLLRAIQLCMRSEFAGRLATRQYDQPVIRWAWGFVSRAARHGVSTISTGPASGLRIDAGGSAVAFAIGNAELPVQEAFVDRVRPGMTVLDIGANIGFMTLLAARLVGDTGSVTALEPVPGNVERIRGNAELNALSNVRVLEFAASDQDGPAQLYVSDYSAFSRLTSTSRPSSVVDVLDVKARTVDSLVADGTLAPPDLVKIDVEGAELAVISGMRETIARHRPDILCEVHDCNVAYVALMTELDYVVTNLDEDVPVELGQRNAHTLALAAQQAPDGHAAMSATRSP